nr:hypothetical protein [Tanacetum cinerariifolium]
MWNDLILAHEGPSDIRDTKIVPLRLKFNAFKSLEGEKVNGTFTRLKCLLNELENNGVNIPQEEVNATIVNSLPRKWLSMNQTQRANKSIKNDSLATLYGNDSDVEEDQMTNNEFMVYLNAEYHERAILENQKRFYKRSGRVGSARKPLDKPKKHVLLVENLVIFKKTVSYTKLPHHLIYPQTIPSTNPNHIHHPSTKHLLRTLEPFPPLPKLIRAAPSGTSENLISLFDLTLNMADLTLDTPVPKKTRPSVKVSPTYVIKKKTKKSHAGPNPCSDKKSDSSTKK